MNLASLGRLLHLRPGEGRRVAWMAAIGIAYSAATTVGDDVAQAIFVAKLGAAELPHVILFKALFDVIAAAAYLPLTRRRSSARVWQAAIAIYIATALAARGAALTGSAVGAYAIYVGHEAAWTLLTIHWGVFILDTFDASQARRLFPLLFTSARLGGIVGGLTVRWLTEPLGVSNLFAIAAGFAAVAGALSATGRTGDHLTAGRMVGEAGDQARVDDEAITAQPPRDESIWRRWRGAFDSPLVRAIAASTALMVLVRYGLRVITLDQVESALVRDIAIAEYLGSFTAWANTASVIIGVLVLPRILSRLGVGFANLLYAGLSVAGYALIWLAPSLASATVGRFVEIQLKDAVKTPLSAMFYGAEPPSRRPAARAVTFGAVIPAATLITGAVFAAVGQWSLAAVSLLGLACSLAFLAVCAVQNRRWRTRMGELLTFKLARHAAAVAAIDEARLARARAELEPYLPAIGPLRADQIARALTSEHERLRAVGEEVLAELVPRGPAHAIARRLRESL